MAAQGSFLDGSGDRGVLFLDEICEFPRSHLEALRQPLEERRVAVARVRATVVFPAEFVLIAAANPCPCGHLGELSGPVCRCPEDAITRYQSRLSGPMRDRIDMMVEVPRLGGEALLSGSVEEPTALVRGRVAAAQARQSEREPPSASPPMRCSEVTSCSTSAVSTPGPVTPSPQRGRGGSSGPRLPPGPPGGADDRRPRGRGAGGSGRGHRGLPAARSGAVSRRLLVPGGAGWPAPLDDLDELHPSLRVASVWVEGELPELPGVAVVGARRATPVGREVARRIGAELGGRGVTVVSGFAEGIDAAAHRGCLVGGGRTVAVLGCGLAVPYPRAHQGLRTELSLKGH